jgi:16S rRNA (cytidine1402-2'-O)-methyltransferase
VKSGNVFLIPNTLGSEGISHVIPAEIGANVSHLRYFLVEDIRTARRLLKRLNGDFPIDACVFLSMHQRDAKMNFNSALEALLNGTDVGIISDAGCPGIADPGSEMVSLAHSAGIRVKPLVGPSSILLALMASGFSGQEFTFHGYLPKERKNRIRKFKDMEMDARRTGHTHIFMDTPFRNMHVLEDLLNELNDNTELCIASELTLPKEQCKTMSVSEWKKKAWNLNKIPALFLIGRSLN